MMHYALCWQQQWERKKLASVMLLHCRLGHLSFDKICKAFPDVMCGVDLNKPFCDACEFAKHTRASYFSKDIRKHVPLCASSFRCLDMSRGFYKWNEVLCYFH